MVRDRATASRNRGTSSIPLAVAKRPPNRSSSNRHDPGIVNRKEQPSKNTRARISQAAFVKVRGSFATDQMPSVARLEPRSEFIFDDEFSSLFRKDQHHKLICFRFGRRNRDGAPRAPARADDYRLWDRGRHGERRKSLRLHFVALPSRVRWFQSSVIQRRACPSRCLRGIRRRNYKCLWQAA